MSACPLACDGCRHERCLGTVAQGQCLWDWIDAHPDGATQEQVGEVLGVTHTRVYQIENGAMAKMREHLLSEEV